MKRSCPVYKSQTVEWPTPQALYKALDSEFRFNFDPCPLGGRSDANAATTRWMERLAAAREALKSLVDAEAR